mgnify:CR=1 FL=1
MDDAYFGSPRKGKDGRGTDKAKAVLALSKDGKDRPQYLRIQVIERVSIIEIKRVARRVITAGSTIVFDGHAAYKLLAREGFQHEAKVYYKKDEEVILKSLHKIIGNLKTFILGTFHGLGEKYLQSYFDEFCFRFNRWCDLVCGG